MASFDDESNSGKSYPLPIFYENVDITTETSVPEGRGRGGRRPPIPNRGRSRGRGGGPHSGSRLPRQNDERDNFRPTNNQRGRNRGNTTHRGRGRGGFNGANRNLDGLERQNEETNGRILYERAEFEGSRRRSVSRDRRRRSESRTNITESDPNNQQDIKLNKRPSNFKGNIHKLLQKDDPNVILLDIIQSRSGFVEFVSKEVEPRSMFNIVNLLCKVTDSDLLIHRREVMEEIEKSFLNCLTEILNKVSMRDRDTNCLWHSNENLLRFLVNTSKLICMVITTLPSSLGKCKSVITAMKDVKEEHNIQGLESALREVEEVFKREKEARQRLDEETVARKSRRAKPSGVLPTFEEMGPPPDDFREIPIFPTLGDLQVDEKPFLRANKTKGKYDDLDTYLDVQFRLLREDYVQPLRKGITEYRTAIKEGVQITRLRDIRLYNGVQILRPVCSGRGINHILQFDTTKFKSMNWTASRRLLYGSLLCLSKDHFDTVYYATVTDRDAKDLSDGVIQVYFENKDILEILPNDVFVMAETTAYFEAFRYVLEGLQGMDYNMPLQRYIIQCETSLQPPRYLRHTDKVKYDFTCLLKDVQQRAICPVLDTQQWPSASDLGLDSSQYEAIVKAITQELAIIQGPPGTGKTFVGLKITELLLSNSKAWKRRQECPILVVCYTNHALDQFLEGISGFSECKIVRIGGRCKSDILQPFILKNLKQKRKEDKKRSFGVMQSERDSRSQLRESERNIEQVSNQLKKSSNKIISFNKLSPFMTEEQRNAFEDAISGDSLNSCLLSKWLSFETPNVDENKSAMDKIIDVWKLAVLENVTELPDFELNTFRYVWDLELIKRAEIYKSWISELKENIQIKLSKGSRGYEQSDVIQSLLFKANNEILDIETLLQYVLKPITRLQIQMLFAGQVVSTDGVIVRWLDLTGRKKAVPFIRAALETIEYKVNDKEKQKENVIENDDEDLEEERQLDEEDDFLFDYTKPKDIKPRQIKDDDEWLLKFDEKKCAHRVKSMFNSVKPLRKEKAELYEDVWRLQEHIRRDLYCFWVQEYRQYLKTEVKCHEEDFNKATEKLSEVRDMETLEILKEADVMGMTTTGAAKYRKLLQSVRPNIIIVEEAAEVLESHIVTTLNANCQHLILVGDHKQLRPSTTVYELSKKYDMDISLFERMVRNEVPCVTLEEQHRMRPEISTLLRHKNLYPQLRDHESVLQYENLKGVDENVQFIDHEEPEAIQKDSTSYSNPHEAKFVAAMCLYLLNQGYSPNEITVITPYMGQVLLLRREMPKTLFEGIRITAVDNFQGEENDIILLSLVRSGSYESRRTFGRNMIGFVGIENRICVSLSRAKKGLYVVGNFKLLERYSSMWEEMVREMREKGLVKSSVTLRCQNHPDQTVFAEKSSDFEKVPNGGCKRPCEGKLPCGHRCPKSCHNIDRDHLKASCMMPCTKVVCEQGHKCTQKCYQKCGKCKTSVLKKVPSCGHKVNMPCHMEPSMWKCMQICTFELLCGHQCNKLCHECTTTNIHEQSCKIEVTKTLPCTHTAQMKCFDKISSYNCKMPCDEILNCKHRCSGTCRTCFYGRIHKTCRGPCGKRLPCGHNCNLPCSEVCPPCRKQCEWKCSHATPCKRKCWEECEQCRRPCCFRCKHKKCEQECYEECQDVTCEERCKRELTCGHVCRGICGETCICIICSEKKVRNDIGDTFNDDSVFIQLPNCQCIFEYRRLELNLEREITSRHGDLCKHCPHCSKPITKNMKRYTNELKRTRNNITERYRRLFGSDIQRKREIAKIALELKSMHAIGLSESECKYIEQQYKNPDDMDAFRVAGLKIAKLKQLLPILNDIKQLERSGMAFSQSKTIECLVNPQLLRDTLIEGRKLTTKQFWNEIQIEIERLRLVFGLFILQEYYSIKHKSSKVEHLFELVFQTLSIKMLKDDMIQALNTILDTLKRSKDDDALDDRTLTNMSIRLLYFKRSENRGRSDNSSDNLSTRTKLVRQLSNNERSENTKINEVPKSETTYSKMKQPNRKLRTEVLYVRTQDESAVTSESSDSIDASNAEADGLSADNAFSVDLSLGSDSYEPVRVTTSQSFRENESAELTSEIEIVYNNDLGTLV